MRPKTLNFDQLVNQNKQELLMDEEKVSQIEIRLEKKQTELVMKKRRGINL
ncbi:FbpB family small basic protein [Virgibacillus indicus]|uniref:FbpB family small basic protein n=1 Tax=Virgibacillus indicus TaxID=2024554 RepID=A0A265NFD3_9BACI|nr:FbpB family small basic protein [Virgibacillus indicus]OZU90485.1 FbpB family small basic protein [Virgibacillus indicus]